MLLQPCTQTSLVFLHAALQSPVSRTGVGKTDPFLIKTFFWLGEKLRALGTRVSVLCLPLPFVIVQGQSPSSLEHMVLFLILLLSIFGGERSNCMFVCFFYSDKAKTFGSRLISFGELPTILSSYFRVK